MAQANQLTNFSIPELIIKKRDGQELTRDEIEFFVNGVVSGTVQQAQIGKLANNSVNSLFWL